MIRRLWGFLALTLLAASPAMAHPGDHAWVRIQVRGPEVVLEVDVPGHVLAGVDADGDFLITRDDAARRAPVLAGLLRRGLVLSSRGVSVPPRVEVLMRPAARRASLLARGDTLVTLGLTYRWPWPVTDLRLRFGLFPQTATPDCMVRVDGLGQRTRVKLTPAEPEATFGTPAFQGNLLWLGARKAMSWALLLCLLGLLARTAEVRSAVVILAGVAVGQVLSGAAVLVGLAPFSVHAAWAVGLAILWSALGPGDPRGLAWVVGLVLGWHAWPDLRAHDAAALAWVSAGLTLGTLALGVVATPVAGTARGRILRGMLAVGGLVWLALSFSGAG
ncbi:MAG: hypothetical protein AB1758_29580 [Candidatus Eremiobacterota bacterium]